MSRMFRYSLISVLSACLIYSPLFSLKAANASPGVRQSTQDRKLPLPQQLAEHEPNTLLVKFYPHAVKQAEDLVNVLGKRHELLRGGDVVKLTLKDGRDLNETLDLLRRLDGAVEWVEPNFIVERAGVSSAGLNRKIHPNRTSGKNTSRLKAGLQTSGLQTSPTIIAVIDSGIDLRHRDLKHRVWLNDSEKSGVGSYDDDFNGFVDDIRGWNFVADNNDVSDDIGHGAQVAGIIASQLNNQPSISILPLKALNKTGKGAIADVVEAMDYAVARRAAVINCSFGSSAFSRAMLGAIKRAEAKGIVVVAAAGNRGKSLSETPFYPASYRAHQAQNLISVAATDRNNLLAGFSNYAADIAAPGENIRTAHRGNSYVNLTGTSASAGFVTATAGLLKSVKGWVSAPTIRDTILKSARESFDLKDKVAGKGVVNTTGALSLFTRNDRNDTGRSVIGKKTGKTRGKAPRAGKTALQSGDILDTMRNTLPQAPNAYSQTGTLPAASYTDPKPATTANFNSYMTRMSLSENAAGVAGNLPMQSVDPTIGSASISGLSYNLDSRNYNFSVPVVSLTGRAGMDVSFTLSYNGKTWMKDPNTNKMVFNASHGFPAPGWNLGFGAIQWSSGDNPYYNSVTGKNSVFYIAPDGTRHDLAYNPSTNRFVSYDSSYLEFDSGSKILRLPNGTQTWFNQTYQVSGSNLLTLPTLIKDRNGNQIDIYYRTLSNNAVVIDYVIDTAGRRIDFNYQNNRLTWIGQNRSGVWAHFVRIDYTPVTIQTLFESPLTTDPVNINGTQVYLPSRLTYPTGVQHRLYYNGYAQINKIEKWLPSIANQGVERRVAYTRFEFGYLESAPQTDCPRFIGRFDQAENWQGGSEQGYAYVYDPFPNSSSPPYDHYHDVIDPSGRSFKLFYSGLIRIKATYAPSVFVPSKEERVTYMQDAGLPYASNLRVQETRISDNSGNVQKVGYSYTQLDGMWLPATKDEYQGDSSTVYRRTVTNYTSYPAQRILGLVSQRSVYAGPGTTLMARISNAYDETGTFVDSNGQTAAYFIDATADGVIQHDSAYGSSFTYRGNLTSVTKSSVVGGAVNGSHVVSRTSYDTNGNVRAETDGAGNRRQLVFTDNYSNKPVGVGQTHAYVYTSADPTDFRTGSQYDYFEGHVVKTFNLKPGSSVEEQIATSTYDFADRLLAMIRPDGGSKTNHYWDNWGYKNTSTSTNTGQSHFEFLESDGAGRVRRKANDHPDGAGAKYSGQQFVFDKVGMRTDQSNVIAIWGDWAPHPEDAATGWIFTNTSRDELVRLKLITRPDGNTVQYDYTGCGCAGTSTVTETDETGCKVKTETDFLGRVWKVTEMSSPTTPYNQVTYTYDALDRITQITHANGSGSQSQTRSFVYDGYGRLQSETNPESGTITYTYNLNDGVETISDQRGIVRTYAYNTRNLPTNVSYNDGGATPSVSFGYDEFGARSSMTDGEGAASYVYNSLRQLQSETRTFTNVPGKNFTLSYTYNLANQVKSVNNSITQSGGGFTPEGERQAQAIAPPRPRAARQKAQAAASYSISGTVLHSGTGQPIQGVTVTATRQDDPPLSPPPAQTNQYGQYMIEPVEEGLFYTVSASKSGYTFSPAQQTVEIYGNTEGINFTGAPTPTPPSGTLTANPNPIQVCNGSGQGVANLSWTASGSATSVQIRAGSPNGTLVASGGTSGNVTTGAWVTNGTVFYLQNVTGGLPLTSANTLATRTVQTTTQGCPPSGVSFNKTINYARNKTGSIAGVGTNLIGTDPNATTNVASAMTYRAWNAYSGMNYGNGLRLTAGYNSQRRQLTSFVVDRQDGSSSLWRQYYNYYEGGLNNGRIRKISDQPDFSTHTKHQYDSYNRLTLVTSQPSQALQAAYGYDEWGNIRTINSIASGGATLNYQTNATGAPTNRLSNAGGFSFSYDAAGNMTAGNGQTFSYDGANRLKGVGGVANQYGYDGDGNRVRQPGLYYVWSSVLNQVAFEVDASANVQRAYVYLGKEVLALQSMDGNFYWSHTDHLSSGRMLTTTSGTMVYRANFDPFGQLTYEWSAAGNMNLNTRKFAGYERDATGLDYARARTYTSNWGRFVQADPLGSGYRGQTPNPLGAANQHKPQTLNRYSYVSNDPINFTDPSGLLKELPGDGCICCDTGGGGGDDGGGGETCQQCVDRENKSCERAAIACVVTALGGAAYVLAQCLTITAFAGFIICVALVGIGGALIILGCAALLGSCRLGARSKCPQCTVA